jgi:hypothetical protein
MTDIPVLIATGNAGGLLNIANESLWFEFCEAAK